MIMCFENSLQISLVSWDQYALGNRITWFPCCKIMSSMVLLMRYFGSIRRFASDIGVSEEKRVDKEDVTETNKEHTKQTNKDNK